MFVDVDVLDVYKMPYGTEVEINYICPHCNENITETLTMECATSGTGVIVCDHECPECGEYNDLDIDFD